MEGHIDSWGARPAPLGVDSPLTALAAAFRAALAAPDVRGARTMVRGAAQAGAPAGRLYVDVVRPALVELQSPGRTVGARLAAGIGEAILADLLAHLPAVGSGGGRAAVLSCRDRGIQSVDGTVAVHFLEVAGWKVQRLREEALERDVPALANGDAELVVAVTTGFADAQRLAPICTALRRRTDPPLILLCDFSGPRRRAASSSLSADATAHDPDELLEYAAQRLPAPGARRWGVSLSRRGETLVLKPTGRLDAGGVHRLADVAVSRSGSFARLVLDLRDVVQIDPAGLSQLAGWPQLLSAELVLLVDELVRRRLGLSGDVPGWRLADRVGALARRPLGPSTPPNAA